MYKELVTDATMINYMKQLKCSLLMLKIMLKSHHVWLDWDNFNKLSTLLKKQTVLKLGKNYVSHVLIPKNLDLLK